MLDWIWKTLLDLVKDKPFWKASQPAILWLLLLLAATAIGYQYVEWRYALKLNLPLYLGSYLFKQVLALFLGLALTFVLLTWRVAVQTEAPAASLAGRFLHWARARFWRLVLAVVVLTACALFAARLQPATPVNRIQVWLDASARAEDFDRDALVYLLYEFNRIQKSWYFEVNFDPIALPPATPMGDICDDDRAMYLCRIERIPEVAQQTAREPVVIISTQPLQSGSRFYSARGNLGVLSTADWSKVREPNVYEYLIYTLTIQAIWMHLASSCPQAPILAATDAEGRQVAHGGLFENLPREGALKAAILVAHLSDAGERALFDCFGPEYTKGTKELLTLDWLRSDRVRRNLTTVYGVGKPQPASTAPQ